MTPENTPQPKAVKAADIVSTKMPPVTGAPATVPALNSATGAASQSAPQTEIPPGLAGQVDSLNRPFDPEKFRPEKDSLDRWKNLKGGRKPRTAAVSAQPQTAPQGSYIPAEPPAPKPENGAETASGATAPVSEAAKPPAEMPAASPKAVAEVATNGVYALTGALIRNPKAARPAPAEHANLRDTAAAYLEARGIRFVGGAAIGIGLLAYCIGDDARRAAIWDGIVSLYGKFFGKEPPMKTVTPVSPETANRPAQPQTTAAVPAPKTEQGQPRGTASAFGNA